MKWTEPKVGDLVACETVAAISLHVRRISDRGFKPGGHVDPRPLALCGAQVYWDTTSPVECVSCRSCRAVMERAT